MGIRTTDVVLVLFASKVLGDVLNKAKKAFGEHWQMIVVVDSDTKVNGDIRHQSVTSEHRKIVEEVFNLSDLARQPENWNAAGVEIRGLGKICASLSPQQGVHYVVVADGASPGLLVQTLTRIKGSEASSLAVFELDRDGQKWKRLYPESPNNLF